MRDLALAVKNIDRHENRAELERGEIQVDHLDAIGEIYAQAVSARKPPSRERARQTVAARVDFPERIFDARPFKPSFMRRPVSDRLKRSRRFMPWSNHNTRVRAVSNANRLNRRTSEPLI